MVKPYGIAFFEEPITQNDALQMVRVHIENTYGPRYVPDKPNFYKSGKSAHSRLVEAYPSLKA